MFSVRPQRDGAAAPHGGWGRGTEMAITPLVFVVIGWLLDRALGTGPWLTLAVAALGFTGTLVKVWIGYDTDMRTAEAGKPWTRGRLPSTVPKRPEPPAGATP